MYVTRSRVMLRCISDHQGSSDEVEAILSHERLPAAV